MFPLKERHDFRSDEEFLNSSMQVAHGHAQGEVIPRPGVAKIEIKTEMSRIPL
jgi:hypothetical protein